MLRPPRRAAYRTIKQIGRGTTSDVFLVRDIETDVLYVMKRFLKAHVPESAMVEVEVLTRLRAHPSIVTVHEAFEAIDDDHREHYCVILSYCSGGDLAQLIAARIAAHETFTNDEILEYAAQLASACDFCHQKGVIHRDVKPSNIFVMGDGRLALGDFGVAKELSRGPAQAETIVGTPYYLSPETVRGEPYTTKVDLWALGVVLYELCQLRKPFEARSLLGLARTVQHDDYAPLPPTRTSELRRLLGLLLDKDPERRASAAQLMRVPVLHVRILRGRSFTPSQAPRSRRASTQQQTVLHAAHEGGLAEALSELHRLADRAIGGARAGAAQPAAAAPVGASLTAAISLDELGDVEPAPSVGRRSSPAVGSAERGARASAFSPGGSAGPSSRGCFDLRVHQCSGERPASYGTLYVTASHMCYVPLLGGRCVSIELNAIACLVKARGACAWGCGTGRSLWIAVSAVAPGGEAAKPGGASAGAALFERFHGCLDRDLLVEHICEAGRAGGFSLPVYAQSGLYKKSSARDLLRASGLSADQQLSPRRTRGSPRGRIDTRAQGGGLLIRATSVPDAVRGAAPAAGERSLRNDFSFKLDAHQLERLTRASEATSSARSERTPRDARGGAPQPGAPSGGAGPPAAEQPRSVRFVSDVDIRFADGSGSESSEAAGAARQAPPAEPARGELGAELGVEERVLDMRVAIDKGTLARGVVELSDVSLDAKGEQALEWAWTLLRRRHTEGALRPRTPEPARAEGASAVAGDGARASELSPPPRGSRAAGAAEGVVAPGHTPASPPLAVRMNSA